MLLTLGAEPSDRRRSRPTRAARRSGSYAVLGPNFPGDALVGSNTYCIGMGHYGGVNPKPWWRRLDGLPPSVERRRALPLTGVQVWLARASLLLAPLLTIVMVVAGTPWFIVVPLVPVQLFSLWSMPEHQRRQVLGRS